ncbi:MAG TPA: EAL domain-containing protein [Gemmatimonadales bacterium]|jgi:diguanylate cyclase (GGDEF)-like protein/PAS domain S-box-containing protein|nr:EAL domain-containing protein [Gemmatimonadales bacterium]
MARDRQPLPPDLQALLDASPDAVLVADRAGRIVALNRVLATLFGTTPEPLLGELVEVLLPVRLRERHAAARAAYSVAPTVRAMSTRTGLMGLRADSSEFPVEVLLTPILGSAGLVMAMVREAPSRSLMQQVLERPDRSAGALDVIPDPVLTTDSAGNLAFLNRSAEQLTGWTRDAARGRPVYEVLPLVGEPGGPPLESPVTKCLRSGIASGGCEAQLARESGGDARVLDISATPIRDGSGVVIGAVMVVRDVTRARHLARQLSHQATHDPLTGLVNRGEFERRLVRALAGPAEEKAEHALCFLDLDGFKRVNDTCGHLAGDELLRQLSELMRERMRSRDTLARLGGDEFGMLLEHCPLGRAARIAEEMREAICAHRFVHDGETYAVGVSIGVVPVRPDGRDPAEVLRDADSACYLAKRRGGSRIQLYDRRRHPARPLRQRDWVRRVIAAIEEDRLQLWAQPLLSLKGANGRAPRLELLLRLEADQAGPLLPGAFLPAARRHGLMPKMDRWVMGQAAQRLADWQSAHAGIALPVVSINLAEETVVGGEAGALAHEALAAAQVPPAAFCFEIGESVAAAHPAASVRLVRELREAGWQVTLEHCGSGMATFALLRRMPVDYLKMAGHIVRGSARDPVDRALVTALNDVGHALGLGTIGIEVESAEVLAALRQVGLDYAQGYEIRRPEPLATALDRLAATGSGKP